LSEVNITELSNKVVINDETSVVEISAPGPAGPSGSAFTPAADSGTGSPVSGTFTIIGGTNVTTEVDGTTVTVNASGTTGGVTSLTGGSLINVDQSTGAVTIDHAAKGGSGIAEVYPSSITIDSFGHVVQTGASTPPAERANNLSDLANADTAITNLGGTTVGASVFKAADAATARTSLELGTAAVEDVGTGDNNIVQLDGSSRLPAVDGSQLTNLPAATSMPASGLTSGSLSIDLIPNADGTLDLGSADFRWAEIHGDLEGSVMFRAKNGNASALSVGDVVYISGYTSGTTPDVDLADANDAAKMPSFGVISTGGNSGAEVYVTTLGTLDGIDLPSGTYSAGDEIFVSTTAGDFTNTAPTGESAAIQKIGFVIKANTGGGTNGSIKVLGAGRSNATPNLDSGKIFYGNGSNQAVSTTLTSVAEAAGSVATHNAITTAHGISAFGATLVDDADAAAARTTLDAAQQSHSHTLGDITDAGTAAALDVGITSNDVLQVAPSGVTNNEFLRVEAIGTKVISRTAAEVLSDIGADNASNLTSGTIPTARIDTGTTADKVVVLDGSGKLPAVDGSQLTGITGTGGGGTDYTMAPITQTWRYFDDFFSHQPDRSPFAGNNQFWLFAGGSGITANIYAVEIAGSRGVGQHLLNANNDRYTYWGARVLSGYEETDGDELIWEARLYVEDGNASSGQVRLGVVEPNSNLNYNDTPPGSGYSAYRFAGFNFSLGSTNVATSALTGSAPGTPTTTDLGSSYPISNYVDTWFRLGVHAKYNATDSDWDITYYINGTSVGTTSMTFTNSLIPYVGVYLGGYTGNVNVGIDWISYQGNIGADDSSRINLIDIGDI